MVQETANAPEKASMRVIDKKTFETKREHDEWTLSPNKRENPGGNGGKNHTPERERCESCPLVRLASL